MHLKEELRDDIVYNYEAALNLDHSDWTGNDISSDSSENDLNIQV